MMGNIFDSIFAPPGALDADVPDFTSPALDVTSNAIPACELTAFSEAHLATDSELAWHNGYGTLNDYEVPAGGNTTFDSSQTSFFDSSFDSGCGSDWP
jgi:hypothetical protein